MRLFKRQVNPIFVEEEQYNWQKKSSGTKRLLFFVMLCGIVALSIAAYIN
jgi:hypothetical protein